MSEDIITKTEEPEIQYILNNTEFVFDSSDLNEEMNDVINPDDNQAYIWTYGHIVQKVGEEGDTVLVQDEEEMNQYLMNDNQDLSLENQQIIKYMDEEGTQSISPQYYLTEFMDSIPNVCNEDQDSINTSEYYAGDQHGDAFLDINDTNWYLNISKYGNLQITIPPPDNNENTTDTSDVPQKVDLAAIKGKNLLTGQVLSLDSYMDKILTRMKTNPSIKSSKRKHNLNAYLNKKLNLGLTVNGKKLMGKIIHVGSKDKQGIGVQVTEDNLEIENGDVVYTEPPTNALENNVITNHQPKDISKESDQFQHISKVLSDLMRKENFKAKIRHRRLWIKVVEKYRTKASANTKNVSWIRGCMEPKLEPVEDNGYLDDWTFVSDDIISEKNYAKLKSQKEYSNYLHLTIITTHYSSSKSIIKIIIDSKNVDCRYCEQMFASKENMVKHVNKDHNACEVCNEVYANLRELMSHKEVHNTAAFKLCPKNNCKKYFMTNLALKKHTESHSLESFKCSLCSYSGVDQADFKAHSLTHPSSCEVCNSVFLNEAELMAHKNIHLNDTNRHKKVVITKLYVCEICNHTFSRQANLHRHLEIHKKTDKLFTCTICGCSYHFSSSLTRHIVKNHVQLQRPDIAPRGEDNSIAVTL
ncbi:PR domain zinc finger protein 15 isoform X2 [Diabrotica virgifera virgifera]|uniref:PR domain zinc finger protein 15-like isoform X2 n=1 Tax=Diabrotica virgifera virgifera TaxID=50390 RepID=A0A6P7F5S1_DIAVI|nr:PR domain zinc finger protein 15 isoform X2 [Diabrotica virgifera virgifera]